MFQPLTFSDGVCRTLIKGISSKFALLSTAEAFLTKRNEPHKLEYCIKQGLKGLLGTSTNTLDSLVMKGCDYGRRFLELFSNS
jgi:hypothetical protein